MPLPSNGILALHGPSKPGEIGQSKPKQAMIVRMSEQTLKALTALQANPQIQVEFGATSGIHIGETFYPMSARKEDIPHDLYLRAAPANKPTAPLKLYANVTGKFFVEQKLESDNAHLKKLRERTAQATEAKQETRTVMLDTPPVIASQSTAGNSKKRKAPGTGMFRKPIPVSSAATNTLGVGTAGTGERKASPNAAAPGPSSAAAGPSASGSGSGPTSGSSAPSGGTGNHPARPRLIHCLALMQRTADEVVRLVGGPRCDPDTRADLLNLLSDVAEPAEQKSSGGTWRLRQRSWLEVRPYDWPKISEQERTTMARTARLKLSSLKIPESDPAWTHVKFRSNAQHDGSPAPAVNVKDAPSPRRGITGKEAKEKAKAGNSAGAANIARPRAGSTTSSSVPSSSAAATGSRTASSPLSVSNSLSSSTTAATSATRPRPAAINITKELDDSDRARAASPLSATSSTQAARRAPPGSGYKTNRGSTPVNAPPTTKTTPIPASSSQAHTDTGKRLKSEAGLPPKPLPHAHAHAHAHAPVQTQTHVSKVMLGPSSASGSARRAAAAGQESDTERGKEKREQEKEERTKERRRERAERENEKEKEREKEALRVKEREREKEALREKEREREKEALRDKEREREKEALRDKEREREKEALRDKEREREKEALRDKEREREKRRKEKEREREKERDREARTREKERQRAKEKDRDRDKATDREREKERERRERDRNRETDTRAEKPRQRKDVNNGTSAVKRKKADLYSDDEDDVPLRTKRKLDPSAQGASKGASPADASSSSRKQQPLPSSAKAKAQRDHALTMKAKTTHTRAEAPSVSTSKSTLSNGKIGKAQPQQYSSASSSSSSAAGAAASSRTSRNRDVPIYTSSEDEGEIKPSFSSSPPAPASSPPARSSTTISKSSQANGNGISNSHRHAQSDSRPCGIGHRAPLPEDRAGLRNRYHSTYGEYIPILQQMMTQKRLVERLLHDGELVEGEEVLSEEELKGLTERHGVLASELEAIRGATESLRTTSV